MKNFKRVAFLNAVLAVGFVLLLGTTFTARAVTTLPPDVIDDFEDGDTSDWAYFGGNAAGGGGGPLDDRPKEGTYYLSTGWGGQGTASGFYGGFFRNFDNAEQVVPPAEPWFNVWVLNQSDATADQYTLEITLREDLDGNGWTDGSEDSVRLTTTFTSAEFDEQWVLVSAPLSSFTDLATGGDGVFNGNLDEVVIVVAGVQGANPSVVEVDFDEFSFTSGGPRSSAFTLFDDMEHGNPFGNGWFAFNGSVGGGGIAPNNSDLPPSDGGSFSLETGWGSGGVPGFFGGFGRTRLTDLSETSHFSFWINPDADQDYTLEINLQEDDNGDGAINQPDDDEFQFNCVVSPVGPCAVSGGGWQRVSIPLADFFDDNSFLFGGNGTLDAVAVSNGGNGELVNIVVAVIGNSGSDVNLRTDYWAFTEAPAADPAQIVDDFENGLPSGFDANGIPIGFYTFSDGSPIAIATTGTPPALVPGSGGANNVLAMTGDVVAFAGFIHGFENPAVDAWAPQDWSAFEGFRVWVYGQNTGTTLFIDILDNRKPGSSSDDAERFSVSFIDDFTGWQQFEFPFASFARKEIGNGAPNDGFTLTQVHGWALGTLDTSGEVTWYVDDAALYGEAEIPALAISYTLGGYAFEEGTPGNITVALNRPMNSEDPAQVSIDFATQPGSAVAGRDYTPASGTFTFTNGGATEQSFVIETFDNSKWGPDKTVGLSLSNPVDAVIGFTGRATAFILDNDEYDPNLLDDFEDYPFLWRASGNANLMNLEIEAGDPLARPGQDAFEGVLRVDGPMPVEVAFSGKSNKFCKKEKSEKSKKSDKSKKSNKGDKSKKSDKSKKGKSLKVALLSTDSFDALTVDHTTVRLGDASEKHIDKKTGLAKRHEKDVDKDGDLDLEFHFVIEDPDLVCDAEVVPLNGFTYDGYAVTSGGANAVVGQDFAIGNNWSVGEALSFWYYGTGSGLPVSVSIKDNRAPDPGPSGWTLVWSEEFNEAAGTQPNPEHWTYELGDGSLNGIPGWGNDEKQYYTDDPANSSSDGNGNLLLTVREADGSLQCYYGACEYTSARLISKRKAEFAYGRIESRILVPQGAGLWPAFWSLGTDIDVVNWPQTGEIDFMEFVGRLPNEIFGTIHGPGYSGGASYGNVYDFGEPVFNNYHTFAVEWEPDLIKWYVDGILYHTATPADVAPNEWVFNDPVFLLLNVAIGGNFGGAIDPNISLPQSMAVDYVRVYQGPDTAERFETSFVDDTSGWREVRLPFTEFVRSAEQPAGAPDDGLGLTEVWGYGFELPQGGSFLLDEVRVALPPAPPQVTVTNLNDSGPGSLRQALVDVAAGGLVDFAPALAGGTLALSSGQLVVSRDVTVDGSGAPGVRISGSGVSRVLQVDPGVVLSMNDLSVADGVGAPQGGGILNFGTLNLDRVRVVDNTETSGGGASFNFGGGGIYNGDGATLNLTDSTVAFNSTLNQPGGGIYGFFNSSINITRSTISGNVGADVAGGLRSLGNSTIVNSTFSGNVSTVWHGGGIFHTDGQLTVTNSTFADNVAPGGTASGILVATFGAPANMTVTNTVISGNGGAFACGIEGGGAATITSGGNNIDTDNSCSLAGPGDQPGIDPLLGPLSDNGGPTLTHALSAGSPAIDAANNIDCPATDQRGVARDAACDAGSFEF